MAKFTLLLATLLYLNLIVDCNYITNATTISVIQETPEDENFLVKVIFDVIEVDQNRESKKEKKPGQAGEKQSEETFQFSNLSQDQHLFLHNPVSILFKSLSRDLPLKGFGDLTTPPPDFSRYAIS